MDSETIYTCYVMDEKRHLEGVVTVKELLMNAYEARLETIMDTHVIKVTTTEDQEAVADMMNRYGLLCIPVVDSEDRLVGIITVETIMDTHVIKVTTTEDQEAVADMMNRYGLLCIPVVDSEDRLVGIITVDDVMEVMEEEATEDFEKMAAMLPSEKPYLKTSVFQLAKNRIPWLLILMLSSTITGAILVKYETAFAAVPLLVSFILKTSVFQLAKNRIPWLLILMLSSTITGAILVKYETAFAAVPLLVSFIPMLMDTGGNSGSQSSTMVIRGMALGEIEPSDVLKVLWKEIRVGFMVGFVLAVVNFIRLMIQYPGNTMICVTVVISMFATVVAAKTIGCTLPIGAKVLKLDPAIMASPMITTIVDAVSLMVYFNLACHLLDMAA